VSRLLRRNAGNIAAFGSWLLLFFGFLAVHAQSPAKSETAVQIDDKLRAKFWRVNAEALAAQVRNQQAQEALKAVQAEMHAACGADPVPSSAGEPSCPAPAPPKGKEDKK
jgi:hypothetical protein